MHPNLSFTPSLAIDKRIAMESGIGRKKFYKEYVSKNKPVILKNSISEWSAFSLWSEEYFSKLKLEKNIVAKKGNVANGVLSSMTLKDYVEMMLQQSKDGKKPSHYLHDFPIFQVMPNLSADIEPFPKHLLPKWYHYKWWNYICFFMGAANSFTPAHIDTLLTNNLFFQVSGYKEFTIVLPEDIDKCYMHNWKWTKVNLDKPDYEKFPLFKEVKPIKINLGPGEILYMPAGTLHQVRGLTNSISFNIDWHTRQTVLKGLVTSIRKKASRPNIVYNCLIAIGLWLNVPPKLIFPYYRSYFSFIA